MVSSSFNTYPEPADVDGADCSISLNTSALLFLTSLCSLVTDSYCGTQAGPLFIHPLIYYYSPKVYNNTYDYSLVQKYVVTSNVTLEGVPDSAPRTRLALGLVLFHFLKRELETILCVPNLAILKKNQSDSFKKPKPYSVHRFSRATMPLFNLLKKFVRHMSALWKPQTEDSI